MASGSNLLTLCTSSNAMFCSFRERDPRVVVNTPIRGCCLFQTAIAKQDTKSSCSGGGAAFLSTSRRKHLLCCMTAWGCWGGGEASRAAPSIFVCLFVCLRKEHTIQLQSLQPSGATSLPCPAVPHRGRLTTQQEQNHADHHHHQH